MDTASGFEGKGEDGLSFMELASELSKLPKRMEVLAVRHCGKIPKCEQKCFIFSGKRKR